MLATATTVLERVIRRLSATLRDTLSTTGSGTMPMKRNVPRLHGKGTRSSPDL